MPDVLVESSSTPTGAEAQPTPAPSSVEIPREPKAYQEWRQSGKLPAAEKTPKAASAPADDSSGASDDGAESVSASEAGNNKQERREPKRSTAETRLKEVLEDLKRAGLTPAELKTFKREAAKAETAPEQTVKPADKAAPKTPAYEDQNPKPKLEDFDSLEQWTEALTDWKAEKRDVERAQREAAAAQDRATNQKLTEAKARYGEGAEASIRGAAKEVMADAAIPGAVKQLLSDSPVLVDVLYTLNSKEGELKAFIDLAKSNPGAAIRKAVLLEHLVNEELQKGTSQTAAATTEAAASEEDAPARDESGKFVRNAPAKKATEAPPPPREAAGRSAAPPDEVDRAAKTGDFRTYREAQNRKDLARHHGR